MTGERRMDWSGSG